MPLSHALPVLVEPQLAPRESLARDRFLLHAVVASPERWPAALRIFELAGEIASIGRWQLAPESSAVDAVLMRRHSGGRAAAFGAGFVGITIVLPARGALLEPTTPPLRPEQVMNRWVRGILGGLEQHRIPALYPGRDTITVRRRQLGIVSYAEVRGGAVLVEAIVATSGDPSVLPRLLDRADPGGVVRSAMLTPADTTSIGAEQGSAPTLAELASWVSGGYAQRLGVAPEQRSFDAGEATRVAALASGLDDRAWLAERHPRDDLDRRASTATMLGALDVNLAVGPDAHIRDACISGDLIAGDDTVPALEEALRGCRPDRASVAAAVTHALAVPGRFLLGIGPVDTLVDTAMRALA